MTFKEFRERNPKSRQKRKDRPTSFKAKPSALSIEEANERRAKIFARKAAPRPEPIAPPPVGKPKGRSGKKREWNGTRHEVPSAPAGPQRPWNAYKQTNARANAPPSERVREIPRPSEHRFPRKETPRDETREPRENRADAPREPRRIDRRFGQRAPHGTPPRAGPAAKSHPHLAPNVRDRSADRAAVTNLNKELDANPRRLPVNVRPRAKLYGKTPKQEKTSTPILSASGDPNRRERVQKLIAAAGLCSRREAEEWIAQGRVLVNGNEIKLGDSATRKDKVTVNGVPLSFPKAVYLVLNKPEDYVTTVRDIYGNKTVMDLVPDEERLYPIGRLDKDTTGVLLFTNDGEFANRVMHPRYEIEKTYVATLDKGFDSKYVATLAKGIRLKEGLVRAKIRILNPKKIEVTIHQGFNHVVKRIMKEIGYWVRELQRTRVGPVKLDIPLGAYRPLRPEEVIGLTTGLTSGGSHAGNPPQRQRSRPPRAGRP